MLGYQMELNDGGGLKEVLLHKASFTLSPISPERCQSIHWEEAGFLLQTVGR